MPGNLYHRERERYVKGYIYIGLHRAMSRYIGLEKVIWGCIGLYKVIWGYLELSEVL